MKRCLLILLVIELVMTSCRYKHVTMNELIMRIDSNNYLLKYSNYSLKPIQRKVNVVVVRLPSGVDYYVRNFTPNNFNKMRVSEKISLNSDQDLIDDPAIKKAIFIYLNDCYELNILRFINTGSCIVIHTTLIDKKSSNNHINYKYVLIKTNLAKDDCILDLSTTRDIYDLKGNQVNKLINEWYYYSTDTYSEFSSLKDFNSNLY